MTRFSELSDATKMFIAGVLIFLVATLCWYQFVYINPAQIFWATVDGNLQTQGVTRHLVQKTDASNMDQYLQLQLGQNNLVSGRTTIERQQDGKTTSKVVTEDIGTPTANYSKYTELTVPTEKKSVDLSSVVNVWSIMDLTDSSRPQSIFSEVAYGVLPFGRLNNVQRAELVSLMQDKKVYTIDYESASRETVNGRQALRYKVKITPEAYITVLQKYDQMMNLKMLTGVDPTAYANQPPFEVEVVIDMYARQIMEIKYVSDETRQETYSGYGIQPKLDLPQNPEPRNALEQRLSKLFQ